MNKIITIIAALALTACAQKTPLEQAAEAVIAANEACMEHAMKTKTNSKELCSVNTQAAMAKYRAERLKVTTSSPQTDQLEQDVRVSSLKAFGALMKYVP